MKLYAFLLAACLLPPVAFAQKTTFRTDTLLFEDFGGKTLNRNYWNVEVTGRTVNNEQQAYIDSASVLHIVRGKAAEGAHNGALEIQPHYNPGYRSHEQQSYDFVSGRINTQKKFEFTYGTATARIKMPAGAGLWPAFWLLGEGSWPGCGEIDIMEMVGDPSWVSHALHGPAYFGNTPFTYRHHFPAEFDVTRWHTYSVDWTDSTIVFKVDGQETYTVTKAMIEKYGRWAFDNPKFVILNFAVGGGYPNGVNKITVPYFGLSEASVDLIKQGQAKMLVDWVLVTRQR